MDYGEPMEPLDISGPDDRVRMKCFLELGQLKVKILTNGYSHDASVKFPLRLKEDEREFLVPPENISISYSYKHERFIYNIDRTNIKLLIPEKNILNGMDIGSLKKIKELGNYNIEDFQICEVCGSTSNTNPNILIITFVPCGHRFMCINCAKIENYCSKCKKFIKDYATDAQIM